VPSLGHVAVGLAVERWRTGRLRPGGALLFAGLALLPDADAIGFLYGIRYGAPWGHRGASHSLVAAAAVAVVAAAIAYAMRRNASSAFGWVFAVVASHGLLDTLTDGGKGVALAWPFSYQRYFAPWRPIPVAPIGLALLSARGLGVMATEAVLFLPLFGYALWPRSTPAVARRS
jgi:inner membrane protein